MLRSSLPISVLSILVDTVLIASHYVSATEYLSISLHLPAEAGSTGLIMESIESAITRELRLIRWSLFWILSMLITLVLSALFIGPGLRVYCRDQPGVFQGTKFGADASDDHPNTKTSEVVQKLTAL